MQRTNEISSDRRVRVWVDTDLALGAPWRHGGDVDDGYALAALLCAPNIDLVGVSTVFGNTDHPTAWRCAQDLLAAAGSTLTVVPGASGPSQDSPAAEAISGLTEGVAIVALGPLTNVARAARRDPSLASRCSLRLVGGNLSSRGRFAPWWPFEFNLAKDPAAAVACFEHPFARRVAPIDVCRQLVIGPAELRALAGASSLGETLVRGSTRWRAYAPLRYQSLAFPLWDLVPALDVIGSLGASTAVRRVKIVGRGGLRNDPSAGETTFVTGFDPTRALAEFQALLRSHRLRERR